MATYTIEDLERATYRSIAPTQWTEELPLVEKVRKGVYSYLDNGGIAYGFSTLFGHLDNNRLLLKDQKALMQSHNISAPEVISSEMMRSITTMKISLIEESIPFFRKQLSILDKICGHMEVHSKQKHHVSNSW